MRIRALSLTFTSVVALVGCGDGEQSHPMLHCDGSGSSFLSGDIDLSGPGWATVDDAKAHVLNAFVDEFGGTVIVIDDQNLGLLDDGAVRVVAPLKEAPAGGYYSDIFYLCDNFVPKQEGPPDTAPLVTN
ncbi:MAG: hypothetical protein ACI9N0_001620 [Ilumatobacter sp.]|jgi:hypothetical protein|tara:strand:+ start:1231 stop:1620 length:390 start_codon:yes stop_codon:yes gene_type:complete